MIFEHRRPDYCFSIDRPRPDLNPPSETIRDPDRLFNDLYAESCPPGVIARNHNITLEAVLAFASSPETRAKLDAFKALARDRAELITLEARLIAAGVLYRCVLQDPVPDAARIAAAVLFRSPCH